MNIDNLLNRSDILISGMKENKYRESRVNETRRALRFLEKNKKNSWNDYRQAFTDFVKENKYSQAYATEYSTIFYFLEEFDRHGIIPDHSNKRRPFMRRSSYDQLNEEFRKFVDFADEKGRKRNLQESTLRGRRNSAAHFLLSMMERGLFTLKEINEDDVLSYYLDEEENLKINSGTADQIRQLFSDGKEYGQNEGERVYNLLIKVKSRTKNQPVLSDEEVEKIRAVLADKNNGLDYRDRAMVSFLLYTGVRASDVTGLTFNSINREDQEISIIQQKTNSPLTIPFIAQLQKVLDEYIEHQRPDCDLDSVFLTKTPKPRPIGYRAVYDAVTHVFDTAQIRMHGERRGAHIFRRYFATKLLGKKYPRAAISKLLGHKAPDSIEPYLGVDYENIKKRALSIEAFPVDEEVFKVCEK